MTRLAYWAWGANAGLLVGHLLSNILDIVLPWMVVINFVGLVLIILDRRYFK